MYKISLISLGCSKNTVDSESILGMINKKKYKIFNDLDKCDVIVINTCGFIEDAKKEAISVIFNSLKYNKKIIVIGCLVERYKKELEKEIPEVDAFISIKEYDNFNLILDKVLKNKKDEKYKKFNLYNRILSTPKYVAYLKISEGCNNFCSFCAIPFIRGRFHSFDENKLINYTKKIVSEGVKELYIISQDTVSYGKDLKNKKINLCSLLRKLEKIKGLEFIKVLYTYPNGITDEYLNIIAKSKKIAPYFDIPLQHVSSSVLKDMNRKDTYESITNLYNKIKLKIKNPILRTTLMVGFPNESKKDFDDLYNFVKEIKFHHLGVFTYSMEEKTKASLIFKDNVSQKIKDERKDKIMNLQKSISYELNKKLVGTKYKAIITNIISDKEVYVRCNFNSIDDIDGRVIVKTNKRHKEGDIINIKITNAYVYDLLGKEVK